LRAVFFAAGRKNFFDEAAGALTRVALAVLAMRTIRIHLARKL
jgi:heme exporter protein D